MKLDRAEDEGRRGSTLCNPPPDLPAEIYRSFSTDPFPLSLSSPFNDNTRIFDAYSIVKAPPRSPRPCIRHTSSRSNYSLHLLEETNLYLSLQDFVFVLFFFIVQKKKNNKKKKRRNDENLSTKKLYERLKISEFLNNYRWCYYWLFALHTRDCTLLPENRVKTS